MKNFNVLNQIKNIVPTATLNSVRTDINKMFDRLQENVPTVKIKLIFTFSVERESISALFKTIQYLKEYDSSFDMNISGYVPLANESKYTCNVNMSKILNTDREMQFEIDQFSFSELSEMCRNYSISYDVVR